MYKLNRRVTIERYAYTVDDYGGTEANIEASWGKWAQVDVQNGRIAQQVNSVMWTYDTRVIMRRFPSRPIRSNDIIVYEGDRYMVNSVSVENEGFKHFEVCRCTRIDSNVNNGSS